jgi:hypothetical protein
MELKTTREATNYVATWYFRSILWNPEVHNRIHKSSPLVAILSYPGLNPIHTAPTYL